MNTNREIKNLLNQIKKEKDPDRLADLQERLSIAQRKQQEKSQPKDRTLVAVKEDGWLSFFKKGGK